jgi:reductive dehalogenase
MSENYEVLPGYRRFNQKYNAIMRSAWDPTLMAAPEVSFKERTDRAVREHVEREEPGFGLLDFAFNAAAGAVATSLGTGINRADSGLTSWKPLPGPHEREVPPELRRLPTGDPARLRKHVEKVARFLGAELVGFTGLDERWLYARHYRPADRANPQVELPEGCREVIVLGVPMDYEMMRTAPTAVMMSETHWNYSRMAVLAGSLAEFIRALGYTAVPALNDTALTVPLAVDAGLGQPSRMGLVVTPEFGPRVRFCKIFTNLPLGGKKEHVDLGLLEFCEACEKCAQACPARSIAFGPRTTEARCKSNNPGVLKWYTNYETCRRYWAYVGTNCGICLRVCPFNHGKGFHHAIAQRLVRLKWRWVNRLLVKLHDWLGYGKQKDPHFFWNGAKS